MTSRSGIASLPLHRGRVPQWLARRMAELGAAVVEAVVLSEGRAGLLRRLSDPFWFQSFGAVLGMDWHSSGITTSVMGALKRGLAPRSRELGIYVCGGRGKHSRRTPDELLALGDRTGLDGAELVKVSKLVAKVDGVALQDGFSLYLHSFVVTEAGEWVVVQQGMNEAKRQARRYHWRSEGVKSFVEEPHEAIVGPRQGTIVNLTDLRASGARKATVELTEAAAESVVGELVRLSRDRHAQMPAHHEVRVTDVFLRRLQAVIAASKERGVTGFEDLLLTPGLGPRTMQALALVAEVTHGTPSRFDDPARFAFAHGGKDGHPHPVPLRVYDQTIEALRRTVDEARLGRREKLEALRRLDRRTCELERQRRSPSFEEIVDDEWHESARRGGTTVFGPVREPPPRPVEVPRVRGETKQLSLFS